MTGSILDRLKAKKVDSKGFTVVKGHDFDTGTGERITPIGQPEVGFINPPDLEPYVSEEPASEVLDDSLSSTDGQRAQPDSAGAMDREALKSRCVALGLCDANDRRREPALRALLQANQCQASVEPGNMLQEEFVNASPADALRGDDRHGQVLIDAMQEQPEEESIFSRTAKKQYDALEAICPVLKPIGTLYIGCLPSSPVCDAQSIIAEVLPRTLEAIGQPHVKLADFGKGTALLAAAVEEYLSARHYPAVFADRILDADVLQVLVRISGSVVRGL